MKNETDTKSEVQSGRPSPSRRDMMTKLLWAAPAVVATAAVNARAQGASGGGSGGATGCGP